jgi:hypothetical protein
VDIRENRSSIGSVRESELPIVPFESQGQHNLERGKGQYLHHVSEGGKEREIAEKLETPDIRNLWRELYQSAKQICCESLWKKMIGKPCAGKPHARFDAAGDGKVLWIT